VDIRRLPIPFILQSINWMICALLLANRRLRIFVNSIAPALAERTWIDPQWLAPENTAMLPKENYCTRHIEVAGLYALPSEGDKC